MKSRVALLTALWVLASVALAPARTLTVGGDAEFPSIQAAIDAALAGDAVEVAAGIYHEHIVMKSDVDVTGAGAERTTIAGNAALGSSVVQFDNVVNATLSGFEITSDAPIAGSGLRAVTFVGAETDQTAALERCVLTGTQYGIFIWNPSTPTITNDTLMGAGLGEQGIYIGNGPSSPILRNNIISGYALGIHVVAGDVAPSPVFAYNDVWNNETNYEKYPDQTGLNGNISADPLFIGAGDLHLQGQSPAVDAGDPDGPLDPDGTRADLGALPYSPSAGGRPSALTLECALDADLNNALDDADIQQAIRLWIGGTPAPGSGGQTINDDAILKLIRKWISAERFACDLPQGNLLRSMR